MNLTTIRRVSLCATLTVLFALPGHADVLYRNHKRPLFDGKYGPVALAQQRINAALVACGKPGNLPTDGTFGPGAQAALITLAQCPAFATALASDPEARAGALTGTYWQALVGTPAPTTDDRSRTVMLTFEQTDYVRAEWNFCQSKPVYNPSAGKLICYSNDPHSYITWGPNGATAGGGREIQLILQAADAQTPALIDASFTTEAGAVRRMFKMKDKDADRSLETYLCGVWADNNRRAVWKTGFSELGRNASVRQAFDNYYKSASLDGGKIATFYKAYKAYGLVPTELDYAFFKDRAAHTTPNYSAIEKVIKAALATDPQAVHWKVRQAIALNVRPAAQKEDRLGRDVAFYLDGADGHVSAAELTAWRNRGGYDATDAGLSDARQMPNFTPGPVLNTSISAPAVLTAAERAACPVAVLKTQRPLP